MRPPQQDSDCLPLVAEQGNVDDIANGRLL